MLFVQKSYVKKQYSLRKGNVLKYTAFIAKGAMRQYCVDDKGNEKIVHFYSENHGASDRESLISLQPSVCHIEAWENTEMLIITPNDFFELTAKIPTVAQMHRVMDQRHAIALHRRLSSMIVDSAEMRYLQFANNYSPTKLASVTTVAPHAPPDIPATPFLAAIVRRPPASNSPTGH